MTDTCIGSDDSNRLVAVHCWKPWIGIYRGGQIEVHGAASGLHIVKTEQEFRPDRPV